jgi:hypothetical protein
MSYLQTGIVSEKGKCFNQLALSQEVCVLTSPKDAVSLNQMSLKKGLDAFGERAEVAVKKEYNQFHSQDVLRPKYAAALSFVEKQEAMRLIMTIKEKKRLGAVPTEEGCEAASVHRMPLPRRYHRKPLP